jgi:LuxR family glucitol operon transcriptional activator
LVRAFAKAKLSEWPDFEKAARSRWVEWYVQLVLKVGFAWDDLSKLELLDPEYETIHFATEWTLQHQQYTETLQLTKGIQYYYNVRGLWDKKLQNNLMRAEAARQLGKSAEEIEALADHVQMLSKQDNISEAESYLGRLQDLAQATGLPGDIFFLYHHAIALYKMACKDLDAAQQSWRTALSRADQFLTHTGISNRHWLAICLYRQGQLTNAKQLFYEVLNDSIQAGYERSIIFSQLGLANIDLDMGDCDSAAKWLAASSDQAHHFHDRSCIAQIQLSFARLHILRNDLSTARSILTEVIDPFKRLGMRRQLDEALTALTNIEGP